MRRRNRATDLATALVLAVGLLGAGPLPATQAVQQPVDLVKVSLRSTLYFSPNGDGVHDHARLVFRVLKPARVTVTFYRDDTRLLRSDLGRLDVGGHRWVWDGRLASGKTVPDGYYHVVLRATRDGKTDKSWEPVLVDTANEGRLVTGRRTVFPQADVVHDRIQVVLLGDGWNPYDADYGDIWQARTSLRIIDHKGRLVWRDVVKDVSTPTFEWDGTDGDGHSLGPGSYDARLRAVDGAGNILRLSRRLRISSEQLVEKVWTTTVAAADALHYEPYFGGCNGCGEVCSPVPSTRFPQGLSYEPCASSFFFTTRGYYAAEVPVPLAPVDEFRIGVNGGPTTPGALDHAMLVADEQATDVTGEGTTTSQWYPVTLNGYPYLPDLELPVQWTLGTDKPDSYDVASFTVEYRYFVPESAG
jgi:flagellar hook assembly protein FlgD